MRLLLYAITVFLLALLPCTAQDANNYVGRGNAWIGKDEYDKAIADFDHALQLNPKNAIAHACRGYAWGRKGQYNKATADFDQALRLDPKDAYTYSNLASIQATCPDAKYRDGQKAVLNAKKAYELDGRKNWAFIDILAAAYAERGDFAKAVEWETKATEMAQKNKSVAASDLADARSRLELYKAKKPYREVPKKSGRRG